MTGAGKQQIDKEMWNKVSFYIDVIVFAIIAVCIYFLIVLSYAAGSSSDSDQIWFSIAGCVAFLAICLTWIFFRLYRYRGQLERRYR